jgi:hypothetical protein
MMQNNDVKIPVSVLQDNLQDQLKASSDVLEIVSQLADMAKDDKNAAVTPAIAPYLERLARISDKLSQSANTAAKVASVRYGKD